MKDIRAISENLFLLAIRICRCRRLYCLCTELRNTQRQIFNNALKLKPFNFPLKLEYGQKL